MILPSHVTEIFLVSPLGGAKCFFSTPNFSEMAEPGKRSWPPLMQVYSPYTTAKPGQYLWCILGVRDPQRNLRKFWFNIFLEFKLSLKVAHQCGFICPFHAKKLGKILTCRFWEKRVQNLEIWFTFHFAHLGEPTPNLRHEHYSPGGSEKNIFEWGESAPIWGRYGGLKIWIFQYLDHNCSKTGQQKSTIFGMLEDVIDLCRLRDFKQKINFWRPRVFYKMAARVFGPNFNVQ